MLRVMASIGLIQSIGLLLNIARAKVFAVLLGPAGMGVVATIDQLLMSAVQLSNMSAPFTALKYLSLRHSESEESFRHAYSLFFALIALLSFSALIVTLTIIPANLHSLDASLDAYALPVAIALLGIPAAMMMMFLVNVLAARGESRPSVLLTVLMSGFAFGSGALGVFLNGIEGIYIASTIASALLCVGTIIYMHYRYKLRFRLSSLRIWRYSGSTAGTFSTAFWIYLAVCSSALMLLGVRAITLTEAGEIEAGYLHACLAISLSIGAILTPINSLYFAPYVNRKISQGEKQSVAERFLSRIMLVYCLGAALVLLFPREVLTLLFSSSFTEAALVLPWLVLWQFLYQISNVYQQLLIGFDDVRGYAFATITGNIAILVLGAVLIPEHGILGGGIAFVLGGFFTMLLTAVRMWRKYNYLVFYSPAKLLGVILLAFSLDIARDLSHFQIGMGWGGQILATALLVAVLWWSLPSELRMSFSKYTTKWRKRIP